MSSLWIAPLLLVLLSLGWFAVQRAWLACMELPADRDALQRPGQCGGSCACSEGCARQKVRPAVESSDEEN
jgi:hypothetical protein